MQTTLVSRIHGIAFTLDESNAGTLSIEVRCDVAVGRVIVPRKDPKALLRWSHHIYTFDNVIYELMAAHLGTRRRR
jgi:hypothetical protein